MGVKVLSIARSGHVDKINMFKLLTIALNRLTLLYLGFLLVWLGLRFLWFDRFWWLSLLNTFALWLMLPLMIALPWTLWQRQWAWLAGFALPIALVLNWYAPLFLPTLGATAFPQAIAQVDTPTVKVMSFNVLWSNEDYDAIARSLRQENPDIVGFQELRTGHTMPELRSRLNDLYPYSLVSPEPNFHAVGALSRYPIEQVESFAEPPTKWGLQFRTTVQGQPLKVLVNHFEPTSLYAYPPSQWKAIARQSDALRRRQVQQIQAVAEQTQDPVIMLCDGNMSDTSETYGQLRRFLIDSFRQVGWGLGQTRFVRALPILRIDYIWHSHQLQSREAWVGADGNSDHRPVVAILKFKGMIGES